MPRAKVKPIKYYNFKRPVCRHDQLYFDCSPHAAEAGFERLPPERRLAALTHSGRVDKSRIYSTHAEDFNDEMVFPGPLVIPDDALALDPKYPPQSFKSWNSYHTKAPLTRERNTLYVIPSPEKLPGVKELMRGWDSPQVPDEWRVPYGWADGLCVPKTEDIREYLAAFYHKMDVKILNTQYKWDLWPTTNSKKDAPSYVGLQTPGGELVGVRYRPSLDGVARQQLNLTDILDAMLSNVPSDAHAIVMLLDEDLYEDDPDDFCCGRAYGGSRISVVSSFRYNPALDRFADFDPAHQWPASHCKKFVNGHCGVRNERPSNKRARDVANDHHTPPLVAAIEASNNSANGSKPYSTEEYNALWFARVGRTTSHELGHCLYLDHCVYFACVMQGTASVAEDMFQPPYLCPVDLQKLSYALATRMGNGSMLNLQKLYIKERYEALRQFCDKWKMLGMFAAWGAWIEQRLERISSEEEHAARVRELGKRASADAP